MGRYIEPRCKICTSPNRDIYENMRLNKRKLTEIQQKYQELEGQKISMRALSHHFTHHMKRNLEKVVKSDKTFQKLARRKLIEGVKIIDEIYDNLTIARNLIETMMSSINYSTSPKEISVITQILAEIRNTLQFVAKMKNELNLEETFDKDEVIDVLVAVLEKYVDEKTLVMIAKELKARLG